MIRFTIPAPTPSRNVFHHRHWRVEHTAKKNWLAWIRDMAWVLQAEKATGKRRVTITRFGKRRLDADNFVGGLKGILDSLKELGLIKDDSSDWLDLVTEQYTIVKGEIPRTQFVLEDM